MCRAKWLSANLNKKVNAKLRCVRRSKFYMYETHQRSFDESYNLQPTDRIDHVGKLRKYFCIRNSSNRHHLNFDINLQFVSG